MEEIILLIYINVGNKPTDEVSQYMEKVKKNIESKTDKFTCFFVPIRSGDTKIECINPIILDKKEYNLKVQKTLIDYQLKLEEFLSKPIKNKKSIVDKPVPPPTQMIKEGVKPKKQNKKI